MTAVLVNYKIKWDNLFAGKNSTQQGSRSQAGIIGGVVGGVVAALALLVCLLTTVCCLVRNNCCCAPVVKEENAGTEREREGGEIEERRGEEREGKKEREGCWLHLGKKFFLSFSFNLPLLSVLPFTLLSNLQNLYYASGLPANSFCTSCTMIVLIHTDLHVSMLRLFL